MKKIYFVRHGESESNIKKVFQGPEDPLSEKGKKQAVFVADRFSRIPIDVILSSPFPRAFTTAQTIQEKVSVSLEKVDLAAERATPSEITGKSTKDEEAQRINKLAMYDNWLAGAPKHSDEETFEEVRERAAKLKHFLENRPEEKILLVTHSAFMRHFLSYVIFGERVTAQEAFQIYFLFKPSNTGITLYDYDPEAEKHQWKLVTWNDHAHLG